MIKKHSEDPDVRIAAQQASHIVNDSLANLSPATAFDYGGHVLKIGEYDVCASCTSPIAEAQQARNALLQKAEEQKDPIIKEHLQLAAKLFQLEAEASIVRAELHNGLGTEEILNTLLGFQYNRSIHDDYTHSHGQRA